MEEILIRALKALHPIRNDLAVIGGSAHRLFHLHELGEQPDYALLTTEDVDFAASLELAMRPSTDLLERLSAAGFVEKIKGADQAAHTYEYAEEPGSYIEFLAPLHGSGLDRNGVPTRELKFHGLHAEKLRDIDILLHRPWSTALEFEGEWVDVRIANPVTYILQKLLCLPKRRTLQKQGKDILYLFDTIAIFGAQLPAMERAALEMAPQLERKQKKRIRDCAHSMCFAVSDQIRQAAYIASSQRALPPSPQAIAGACSIGLRQILRSVIPDL